MLRFLTAPTVLGAILSIYTSPSCTCQNTELVKALDEAATSPRVNIRIYQLQRKGICLEPKGRNGETHQQKPRQLTCPRALSIILVADPHPHLVSFLLREKSRWIGQCFQISSALWRFGVSFSQSYRNGECSDTPRYQHEAGMEGVSARPFRALCLLHKVAPMGTVIPVCALHLPFPQSA